MSIELMEKVEQDLTEQHITRLKSLLLTAEMEKADRTVKEIKEMIDTAVKFKTIIPF